MRPYRTSFGAAADETQAEHLARPVCASPSWTSVSRGISGEASAPHHPSVRDVSNVLFARTRPLKSRGAYLSLTAEAVHPLRGVLWLAAHARCGLGRVFRGTRYESGRAGQRAVARNVRRRRAGGAKERQGVIRTRGRPETE